MYWYADSDVISSNKKDPVSNIQVLDRPGILSLQNQNSRNVTEARFLVYPHSSLSKKCLFEFF